MAAGLHTGVPELREDETRLQQEESVAARPIPPLRLLRDFPDSSLGPLCWGLQVPNWEDTPEASFPAPGGRIPPTMGWVTTITTTPRSWSCTSRARWCYGELLKLQGRTVFTPASLPKPPFPGQGTVPPGPRS